ncbi:hypothetical protein ASF83_15325 [Plantibacter sp. Leaf171]|uniref:acyltransferase n=1 Tax=unclassified Plantibacter TaxID=2624265 RepID=UPI0006FDD449|nr:MULTISPECIES: acyltransferase [unclassified Plantibacter]KQM14161.1 hypothetical protein ASE44_15340 [Plantibacter sp. Leaf1]KQQ50357.1 hypothetical protein ASF68_14735 [Plantibacter sp. Leaf314]KQR57543.1 hypothetical protein ASF83_15325 [Plantibacter sp. Leaf171]
MPAPFRRLAASTWQLATNGAGLLRAALLLWLLAGTMPTLAIFEGRAPSLRIIGTFRAGRRLKMRSVTARSALSTGPAGELILGDRVFINQGTVIHAEHSVRIGDRVAIGDGVRIYDTGFHPVRPGQATKTEPVVIEDDVWIAAGATILSGVTIGRGAVIGAGAVVTRSVPAGSLVAGPSATVIDRFSVPEGYRRFGTSSV